MPIDHSHVTLHLDTETEVALDVIARSTQRDRSAVIHEAIDAYLDVHRWHSRHIAEGLRQADAGAFAPEEDVESAFLR